MFGWVNLTRLLFLNPKLALISAPSPVSRTVVIWVIEVVFCRIEGIYGLEGK